MKFNSWSMKRICEGRKTITSRTEAKTDDPDVEYITGPLPLWFITRYLWWDEGADSQDELKAEIDKIYPNVKDLYVHVMKPEAIERLKSEGGD